MSDGEWGEIQGETKQIADRLTAILSAQSPLAAWVKQEKERELRAELSPAEFFEQQEDLERKALAFRLLKWLRDEGPSDFFLGYRLGYGRGVEDWNGSDEEIAELVVAFMEYDADQGAKADERRAEGE